MKYEEITIIADTNDGDYVTQISTINKEDLAIIKPLIAAIKRFKPYKVKRKDHMGKFTWTHHHNYPNSEYIRGDLGEKSPRELYNFSEKVFELFEEYVPYGEHGIHTIESITICPLQKKTKLL